MTTRTSAAAARTRRQRVMPTIRHILLRVGALATPAVYAWIACSTGGGFPG